MAHLSPREGAEDLAAICRGHIIFGAGIAQRTSFTLNIGPFTTPHSRSQSGKYIS
jgi:hypothetical protein